jgi:group I intron endonuclease
MIGIYKIISPSNKIYIGQSVDIDKRKKVYEYLRCIDQPILYNSLKKYGWEAHKHIVIEECELEQLNEREMYWGNYYDALGKNGLNCKLGNSKGILREESKQKLKKPKTQEHKDKIGKANRKPKPEEFKEKLKKPKTEQHRQNISKATIGKPKPKEFSQKITELKSKKIQQFDLNGNMLNEFNSIKEANLFLNKNSHSIGRACRGERKTAFNFIWKFSNL